MRWGKWGKWGKELGQGEGEGDVDERWRGVEEGGGRGGGGHGSWVVGAVRRRRWWGESRDGWLSTWKRSNSTIVVNKYACISEP